MFGPLPGPQRLQTVPRGEVYALYRALQLVSKVTPTRIISDCLNVVNTFNDGPSMFDPLKSEHADLRRSIFDLSQNLMVGLEWLRAHTSQPVALSHGPEAHAIWLGNHHADRLAKKGAEIHRVQPELREELLDYDLSYTRFVHFVSKVTLHCLRIAPKGMERPGGAARPPRVPRPRFSQATKVQRWNEDAGDDRHTLSVVGSLVTCSTCGLSRTGAQGFTALTHLKCQGSLRVRLSLACLNCTRDVEDKKDRLASIRSGAHTLRTTGNIQWCEKCGRQATGGKHVKGLALRCQPDPKRGEYGFYQLQRLLKGCHPDTGVPLPR